MSRPLVSAVLVNYNGREYLSSCIESILAEGVDEVLLVDSGSDDGAAQEAAETYPIRLLELGENLGPSAARNRGLREAKHELVLLIDNDVELTPGSLAALTAALSADPELALVQARSLLFAAQETLHYDGAAQHYLGLASLHHWYQPLADHPSRGVVEVDIAISLCCLGRREMLLRVHGYDTRMFILVEDVALSYALRLAGYRVAVAEDALCLHKAGTAGLSTRGPSKSYAAHRSFLLSRNRWIFLLTHYQLRSLLVLTPAFALYGLVHLAFVLRSGHFSAWLRGKLAVCACIGYLWRRRRALSRLRRVGDRQLFGCSPLTFNPGLAETGIRALVQSMLAGCLRFYWRCLRWAVPK